jgi:hypothetical protein
MTLSITTLAIQFHHTECRYAERRDLLIILLNVIMLSVVMLNVAMPSVVILNVVEP